MNAPEPHDPETAADVEDVMLDALLLEILTTQPPPDQSREILRRLHDVPNRPVVTKTPAIHSRSDRAWSALLLVAAALLVAIGVVFGVQNRNPIGVAGKTVVPIHDDRSADPKAESTGDAASGNEAASEKSTVSENEGNLPLLSRRIELAEASVEERREQADSMSGIFSRDDRPTLRETAISSPAERELTLVSSSLSDHLHRYWDRLGLQPAAMLSPEDTTERLRTRFRIDIPVGAIGNPAIMLTAIGQPSNARSLAVQVLAALSSRPVESLDRPMDQRMVNQIRETLRSGAGFDQLYASWFEDKTQGASQAAGKTADAKKNSTGEAYPIGELLKPLGQHESLVVTAAVALNADIRCQRCHDVSRGSLVKDRMLSQHDYWQFAATVAPWLSIRPETPAGWFYDTADGVRRLAEADRDADWPNRLRGSRSLAEGLVGAMWTMVHGRPIASSPFDLAGGAQDTDLERLREELADDLVASDFNLLRTISLMLTDSTIRRGTPSAMTPSGVLTASNEQWDRAIAAIESFAASPPVSMPSTRGHRMRLVQQSDLPTLLGSSGTATVLAQPRGIETSGSDRSSASTPGSSSDANSGKGTGSANDVPAKELSPAVLAGLPMRSTLVMPAWIVELPDFASRVSHIAHLAGLADVPESAAKLAAKMKDARVDEALILQRIWWILRPQA